MRRLHLRLGYDSLTAYCKGDLELKDHEAHRRIEAARCGRHLPLIFEALADGRLHLTAVMLVAPFLAKCDADGLLRECFGKSKREVELVLAHRFPLPDAPTLLTPVTPSTAVPDIPAQIVANTRNDSLRSESLSVFPTVYAGTSSPPSGMHLDGRRPPPNLLKHARIVPTAPQRWTLQVTISQETHDALRRVQDLLAHAVPDRNVDRVLLRALSELEHKLQVRKFGAGRKGRQRRSTSSDERPIPASIRRAVWQRDGGRCTFLGATGHRCEARARIEFDHIVPIASGGLTTASNLRLRCRAHNQYEARKVFGDALMDGSIERARR
jgi:hypothetical protein